MKMSENGQAQEVPERLDHGERSWISWPEFDRRAFLRRTALTGAGVGSVSTLLAACGSSAS
ncbi:MAG TPA: hypothetical protein VMU55_09455, partial [Solirubrobacteraceae bacterium]|nr:hypothetical protein [Solirubrobacteraceae bacterium]